MHFETIDTAKGSLSRCHLEAGTRLSVLSDFLDVLMLCPTDTLILDRDDLAEEFFRLETGLAGEFLQKVSNYRKRLLVLGNFSQTRSRPLGDFILESNRTGQVVFAADLPTAIMLLK